MLTGQGLRALLKTVYLAIPFKKQFFLWIRRFWVPPKNISKYLYFKGVFKVDVADKCCYLHHFGFDIETSVFWYGLPGCWENVSMSAWLELCKISRTILDIGANTGLYSLVAKTINPESAVFCYEPVARVFDKLLSNVSLNGFDIKCEQIAISNYDGDGVIYDLPTEHIYSVTLNKNLHDSSTADLAIRTKVKTMRIDTLVREKRLSKIDLVKIDVETHEPEVLEGLGPYLRRMRPTILLEVMTDNAGRRIEGLLSGLDYVFFSTDDRTPFRWERHIRYGRRDTSYVNYLICQPHIANHLGLRYCFL